MFNLLLDLGSPVFTILWLVIAFGAIALIAFLCYKYIPGLKDNTKNDKTESEIAEEELNRILVPIEEELVEETKNDEEGN